MSIQGTTVPLFVSIFVGTCRNFICQVSDDPGNRAIRDRSESAGWNVRAAEPDDPSDSNVRRSQPIAPGVDRQAHRDPLT